MRMDNQPIRRTVGTGIALNPYGHIGSQSLGSAFIAPMRANGTAVMSPTVRVRRIVVLPAYRRAICRANTNIGNVAQRLSIQT